MVASLFEDRQTLKDSVLTYCRHMRLFSDTPIGLGDDNLLYFEKVWTELAEVGELDLSFVDRKKKGWINCGDVRPMLHEALESLAEEGYLRRVEKGYVVNSN